MSIGLVRVPFFSMINFSTTWGIGLNGAKSMKTAMTIRIEYGILSRIANVSSFVDLYGNNIRVVEILYVLEMSNQAL